MEANINKQDTSTKIPEIQQIDIEKIIKSQKSKVLRALPKFLVNYIKRIVHQDEINAVLRKHHEKTGVEFIDAVLEDFKISYSVKNTENIPTGKRYIFAANHPLGGFDGLTLISAVEHHIGPSQAVINNLLMNLPNLRPLFVGVNTQGISSKSEVKQLEKALLSDYQIIMFPAGFVSRRRKGKIRDLEWKKTFVNKAVASQRDIVPVHITGRLSKFFYNLENTRTFFGIKTNIEMFYLADETMKQRNEVLDITFGKPISYKTFNKRCRQKEWAQKVWAVVYALNDDTKHIDYNTLEVTEKEPAKELQNPSNENL